MSWVLFGYSFAFGPGNGRFGMANWAALKVRRLAAKPCVRHQHSPRCLHGVPVHVCADYTRVDFRSSRGTYDVFVLLHFHRGLVACHLQSARVVDVVMDDR